MPHLLLTPSKPQATIFLLFFLSHMAARASSSLRRPWSPLLLLLLGLLPIIITPPPPPSLNCFSHGRRLPPPHLFLPPRPSAFFLPMNTLPLLLPYGHFPPPFSTFALCLNRMKFETLIGGVRPCWMEDGGSHERMGEKEQEMEDCHGEGKDAGSHGGMEEGLGFVMVRR